MSMSDDKELRVIESVLGALSGLDDAELERVLCYVAERKDVMLPSAAPTHFRREGPLSEIEYFLTVCGDFREVVRLIPVKTQVDTVLLAAAYVQAQMPSPAPFGVREIKRWLRMANIHVANITDALNSLMSRKAALVEEASVTGTGTQRRKTYRVTAEGMRRVGRLFRRREQS